MKSVKRTRKPGKPVVDDGNGKPKQKRVPADEFIQAWKDTDTNDETARVLGMTVQAVTTRASIYRRKGVELKKHRDNRGRERLNWDELKKLAKS